MFLSKPGDEAGWQLIFNLLSSLLRWEHGDDFASSLGDNGLYNIIQLECVAGNSSLLEVRNPQIAGEIYIENGAIVHASSGKLIGEKAFRQLLSLTDGEFRVAAFRPPPARTVQRPWDALLADAGQVQIEKGDSTEDGTILITKKRPPAKPAPVPPPAPQPAPAPVPEAKEPPPKPQAVEPPKPKPSPVKTGMNFITLEEMVAADTTMITKPGNKQQSPDKSK